MNDQPDQPTPDEALALIREARAGIVPPGRYPVSYDLAYGLVCGLLAASQGMPKPWSTAAAPIALMGLFGIIMWWRKKYGWWVSGYSPKRARWIAFGMAGVLLGLVCLSIYGRSAGPSWLYIVSGVAGFITAIVGSRLWLKVWRKELAEAGQ